MTYDFCLPLCLSSTESTESDPSWTTAEAKDAFMNAIDENVDIHNMKDRVIMEKDRIIMEKDRKIADLVQQLQKQVQTVGTGDILAEPLHVPVDVPPGSSADHAGTSAAPPNSESHGCMVAWLHGRMVAWSHDHIF